MCVCVCIKLYFGLLYIDGDGDDDDADAEGCNEIDRILNKNITDKVFTAFIFVVGIF